MLDKTLVKTSETLGKIPGETSCKTKGKTLGATLQIQSHFLKITTH